MTIFQGSSRNIGTQSAISLKTISRSLFYEPSSNARNEDFDKCQSFSAISQPPGVSGYKFMQQNECCELAGGMTQRGNDASPTCSFGERSIVARTQIIIGISSLEMHNASCFIFQFFRRLIRRPLQRSSVLDLLDRLPSLRPSGLKETACRHEG